MAVTKNAIEQFKKDGYFVLERIISESDLIELNFECRKQLDLQMADMERVDADRLGLSHKKSRYFLPCRHEESPILARLIFGDSFIEIIRSVLGNEAYLFLELFVVKWSGNGMPFSWHQDSGYLLGNPHEPYVTLWIALDDMTEENGTLRIIPDSRIESKGIVEHIKDKETNDLVGYHGDDQGMAILVPKGSIIVLSSTTFHCSGPNLTDNPRNVFLVSYSPKPITDRNGRLWNLAVPVIKNGEKASS